jgi:hypothetical protein
MANDIQKEEGKSTMFWWLMFLVTTAITLFMLVYVNEWFWLVLPFSLTSLAKGLDVI